MIELHDYSEKYPNEIFSVWGYDFDKKKFWFLEKYRTKYYEPDENGKNPFGIGINKVEIGSVKDYIKTVEMKQKLKELSQKFKFTPPKI